jgi:hypothetical protein
LHFQGAKQSANLVDTRLENRRISGKGHPSCTTFRAAVRELVFPGDRRRLMNMRRSGAAEAVDRPNEH